MPIVIDDLEEETTENPFSSAALSKNADVVVQDASQYEGKFGAAKGPGSKSVVVLPGRGLITDMVTIVDEQGDKKAQIPYTELHSFHVITGEGKRKPGISFEHKPDADLPGKDIRVWMPGESATDLAEKLMAMLAALHRQHEFEQEFKSGGDDEDGDDT